MIRIYVASKIKHAEMFRVFRRDWAVDGIDIQARWLDHAKEEIDGTTGPEDFKIEWLVDEEDVINAKAMIIYAEPNDKLRGALVEAGIGIASGIFVIVVGEHLDYGTWQHHPLVHHAKTLRHAREMILRRFK